MRINPFVVMKEEFDGTGVVFNPDSNRVMTLNAPGVVLWKALERGLTPGQIEELLLREFSGATPERVRCDLQNFRDELARRNLLVEN